MRDAPASSSPVPEIEAPAVQQPIRLKPVGMKQRRRLQRTLITLFLILVSLIMAAPFIWMLLTSVRSPAELGDPDMGLLPASWEWSNYSEAFNRAPFDVYARNSFLLASVQTVSTVLFGSACGYAIAKLRFRAAPAIFGLLLASLMIPFYATVIPQFLIVRLMPLAGGNDLLGQGGSGWIDTWLGLIVPGAISSFNVFLFRQFYVSTPTELMEAARIDGLHEVGIYARIVTPLIKPGIFTVSLLSFEQGWNNFLWPLLVTTSEELRVLQLGLSIFRQEASTEFHLLMAGTTVAALPMIVLFMFVQRYFANALVSSGIK